jgi:hypothetical protein
MVRVVDIPWVGGGQNTMGREGVQYILIIMGRGVIKCSKFPKNLNFQKCSKFLIFFIKFQKNI